MHPDEPAAFAAPGYFKIKNIYGDSISRFYFRLFIFFKPMRYKKIKSLVKNFNIFVMDGAVLHSLIDNFKLNKEEASHIKFLPVTTGINRIIENKAAPKSIINYIYFGRVEDFKTKPLLKLIRDLSSEKDAKLHIIGDGDDLYLVKKYAASLNLNLKCYGFLDSEIALDLINKTGDIAFSMGISALLCAQARIPVVIMNPYVGNTYPKNYNFIYDEKEYGVGDILNKKLRPVKKSVLKNFKQIKIDCLLNWEDSAHKSYDKYKTHTTECFIKYVEDVFC
jgi:hypothetical protein